MKIHFTFFYRQLFHSSFYPHLTETFKDKLTHQKLIIKPFTDSQVAQAQFFVIMLQFHHPASTLAGTVTKSAIPGLCCTATTLTDAAAALITDQPIEHRLQSPGTDSHKQALHWGYQFWVSQNGRAYQNGGLVKYFNTWLYCTYQKHSKIFLKHVILQLFTQVHLFIKPLCSSRKFPYSPHGRFFWFCTPHPPRQFQFSFKHCF